MIKKITIESDSETQVFVPEVKAKEYDPKVDPEVQGKSLEDVRVPVEPLENTNPVE